MKDLTIKQKPMTAYQRRRTDMVTRMTADQVRLDEHYDVRSWNGIVIGSVLYSFPDGGKFYVVIKLHIGELAYGISNGEFQPFDIHYGDAPWLHNMRVKFDEHYRLAHEVPRSSVIDGGVVERPKLEGGSSDRGRAEPGDLPRLQRLPEGREG